MIHMMLVNQITNGDEPSSLRTRVVTPRS